MYMSLYIYLKCMYIYYIIQCSVYNTIYVHIKEMIINNARITRKELGQKHKEEEKTQMR